MKNLDLKARGIEVMSKQEMNEIEGAIFQKFMSYLQVEV